MGNNANSGCTSQCTVEPNYVCFVSSTNTSECSICGNLVKETREECDQNSKGSYFILLFYYNLLTLNLVNILFL